MTNPIIILGSSRSHGETRKAVDLIIGTNQIPIIDLKTLNIWHIQGSSATRRIVWL
jgi:hypothetical protein